MGLKSIALTGPVPRDPHRNFVTGAGPYSGVRSPSFHFEPQLLALGTTKHVWKFTDSTAGIHLGCGSRVFIPKLESSLAFLHDGMLEQGLHMWN